MRAVPVVISAIVALTLGLVIFAVLTFLPQRATVSDGTAMDNVARIGLTELQSQIDALQDQIASLEAEIEALNAGSGLPRDDVPIDPDAMDSGALNQGQNPIIDRYSEEALIVDRRNVNAGIEVATPSFLEEFLGRPRETLSDQCEPMTNPVLKAMLITEEVGPIKVTMLRPALDSLARVFATIKAEDPDLYSRIGTAGSLCVRRIRGTKDRLSTHSFGLAVDLQIVGTTDGFADGRTQLGLIYLADFFRAEGWVWGAGFGREDSMHFEVSRQQLETWRMEGKI